MSTAAANITAKMLTGPQRAAVLVMYLERSVAREVLRHLSDEELQEVGIAMSDVHSVPPHIIESVVSQFIRDLYDACLVPRTGPEFALDVLPELVDAHRRPRLMSALRRKMSKRLELELERHSARTIAAVLLEEHPQAQAVALLLMGRGMAADVLARFPEEIKTDVALRMARMKQIRADLADEVEESLLAALSDDGVSGLPIQGVDQTAKILGRLSSDDQRVVLDSIAADAFDLAETLRRRMVVFEDLVRLDDRSMQVLLKGAERDKLVIALRGAPEELVALVMRNMSSRAARDLAEEIEVMSPKPRSVVEAAREEIVQIMLQLREEGTLVFPFGDQAELL